MLADGVWQAGAMRESTPTHVLFLGGRSGVGKTTVALEVSCLLAVADVAHALIEGDNLDQAHPAPWREGIDLAERNLAAMWRNYRETGHSRLIYTNTVSVLQIAPLSAALGGDVRVTGVLLTADDATAASRLARREIGGGLAEALGRSASAATTLEAEAPEGVHRVPTDGRDVADIAAGLIALTGWVSLPNDAA